MGKINLGRVLLGGIAAGILFNAGEFLLNEKVLGSQMKEFFPAHKFANPGGSFIASAVALTFVIGIVTVWLYALIRPRLGPGPKAAIVAALIMWLGIYFYAGIIKHLLFGTPLNTVLILMVWGLVEYVIGTLVGAWLYQEA